MRCQQATELMSLELDDMLGEVERRELEAHLATCLTCQQTWTAMRRISELLETAPMVGPEPGFAKRVNTRIVERRSRKQLFTGYAILGAGLLLLLALPLTYLAQPISLLGRMVIREPDTLSSVVEMVTRLGSIVGTLIQAFWLLVQSIINVMPETLLLISLLFISGLFMAWLRLLVGRSSLNSRPALES
jgi:predicted anti-sigma-YlaC factor YlaD